LPPAFFAETALDPIAKNCLVFKQNNCYRMRDAVRERKRLAGIIRSVIRNCTRTTADGFSACLAAHFSGGASGAVKNTVR